MHGGEERAADQRSTGQAGDGDGDEDGNGDGTGGGGAGGGRGAGGATGTHTCRWGGRRGSAGERGEQEGGKCKDETIMVWGAGKRCWRIPPGWRASAIAKATGRRSLKGREGGRKGGGGEGGGRAGVGARWGEGVGEEELNAHPCLSLQLGLAVFLIFLAAWAAAHSSPHPRRGRTCPRPQSGRVFLAGAQAPQIAFAAVVAGPPYCTARVRSTNSSPATHTHSRHGGKMGPCRGR